MLPLVRFIVSTSGHLTIGQREGSMLTFESASFKGTGTIIEKLQVQQMLAFKCNTQEANPNFKSLPFQQIKHQVATMDPQPGVAPDHIMVLVTGQLLVCLS